MYDYKKLLELRKHTLLGLIALIKISREKEAAEVAQILYNRAEHTTIGVDYSIAEKLEFDIRLEKWKKKNLDLYLRYGTSECLDDFSLRMLEEDKVKVKA